MLVLRLLIGVVFGNMIVEKRGDPGQMMQGVRIIISCRANREFWRHKNLLVGVNVFFDIT